MLVDERAALERLAVFAPSCQIDPNFPRNVDARHCAVDTRRVVSFAYSDKRGTQTTRRIWTLSLISWGGQWTVGAWCESSADFRTFDISCMTELASHEPFFASPAGASPTTCGG